jgi:hypothetical protein
MVMGKDNSLCLRYSLIHFENYGNRQGRQRSAISVAAFLVTKHKMTPHDACKLVLDKRPEAFHHGKSLNFDQALKKYYKDVQKK